MHRRSSFSSLLSLLSTALVLEYIQTCCLSLRCWASFLLPPVFFPSSVLLSPLPYLSLTPSLFHSSFISPLPLYLSASVSPHIIHRNGTRSGQTSSTHFLRLKSPVFAGWRDSSTCGCVGVSNTHTCYTLHAIHTLFTVHCSLLVENSVFGYY